MDDPFEEFLGSQLQPFSIPPISREHVVLTASLPSHHRDPFDGMLAAQALVEILPIVSIDPAFDRYGVERLWQAPGDA